jgi:hypothetical protein
MARLLDLPVELILVIIDYLQVDMKQASLLYDGPGYDEGCDLDPPLKSPVECLRLIACGAQEEPLTTVLSWPAALKTLLYDVEQYGWEVDVEFSPKNLYWTCAAFMRTLQWQKATLVELTMTRPWNTYKYIDDGPRLDLSEFTSLKTLRIYHAFLCGDFHGPYGF